MSKLVQYRPPRIIRDDRHGWYIEYYFRIPVELRYLYISKSGKPQAWKRFRVKEDINRRKGPDKKEYALWLCNEILNSLKDGYNPFYPDLEILQENTDHSPVVDEINVTDALAQYLDHINHKGLEKTSVAKYKKVVNRFIEWLIEKRIQYTEVNKISTDHIDNWLRDMKLKFNYNNREHNNHLAFLSTAFNYLKKKKIIEHNPTSGSDRLKAKVTKHRYFDDNTLKKITTALEIEEPYTLLAFKCVYHLCLRSEKELKHLKISNLNFDANNVLVIESKTDQRYVPMDNMIREILMKYTEGFPQDYYLFGIKNEPAPKPFGKGFFSKRFKRVRDMIGISSDYTIYGAKHTRVVHLKKDGVSDSEIKKLGGWTDYLSMSKYMRDLGLDADMEVLNKNSRKI